MRKIIVDKRMRRQWRRFSWIWKLGSLILCFGSTTVEARKWALYHEKTPVEVTGEN
ncbi:MAG: hypothetical protein JMN25_15910 [gamma proteobacterium endosymbiont of Lamellibrachia anaximandri]|nr:hypothetical protein [gamma proteobacterium endosymbiont of Lamellibrachia anaximandri]